MGGDGSSVGQGACAVETGPGDKCKAHFVTRRRAALERFITRVTLHPVLRLDSDLVDFLECDGELPRASSNNSFAESGPCASAP